MASLRKRLCAGEPVVGSWINSGSPIIAELMAQAPFDFLTLDVEHAPIDAPQAFALFQAMRSGNPRVAPMVRLHGVDYALVKRYLDAGARGVIAPLVNTREQAELLVSAVRYPPAGNRGVGFCRANDYGLRLAEETATANDEILCVAQIEHIDAVHNIDDILSVPGVDATFIGPYDLSASMGLTAQFDHPDFVAAKAEILAACDRHGVAAGIHVVPPNPAEVHARIAEGYRLVAYSLDITLLQRACFDGLNAIHDGLGAALKRDHHRHAHAHAGGNGNGNGHGHHATSPAHTNGNGHPPASNGNGHAPLLPASSRRAPADEGAQ